MSPVRRASALGEVVADVHLEREPEGERTIGPGIEFPIPIFNRGRAARLRAESEIALRQHALSEVIARAGSEVRAARSRVESARMRAEYYRDVVIPRRERIVQLTKLEQNAMLAGVYQLLQARQNELDARRDYVEAQRDYWSARNDLERALNGTGDVRERSSGGQRRSASGGREGH
jgi:outer membrane protein, heavy metal efflux system